MRPTSRHRPRCPFVALTLLGCALGASCGDAGRPAGRGGPDGEDAAAARPDAPARAPARDAQGGGADAGVGRQDAPAAEGPRDGARATPDAAGAPRADAGPPRGDAAPTNGPNARWKILPLGDSITAANNGYRGPLYAKLVEAGYDVDLVGSQRGTPEAGGDPNHEGRGGHTIGPDGSRFCQWNKTSLKHVCQTYAFNLMDNMDEIAKADANVVLLLVGINDLTPVPALKDGEDGVLRPVDPKQAPEKLAALVAELTKRKPRAKILVSSLLPLRFGPHGGAGPINAKAKELGEASAADDVVFVDLAAVPLTSGDFPANDVVHPASSAAEKIADGWLEVLRPLLGAPDRTVVPPVYKETFATAPPGWTLKETTVEGKLVINKAFGPSGSAVYDDQTFAGDYTLRLRLLSYGSGVGNVSRIVFNRGDDGSQYFVELGGGSVVHKLGKRGPEGKSTTLATTAAPIALSGKYVLFEIRLAGGAITVTAARDGGAVTLFEAVKDGALPGGKLGFETSFNYAEVDDVVVTKD